MHKEVCHMCKSFGDLTRLCPKHLCEALGSVFPPDNGISEEDNAVITRGYNEEMARRQAQAEKREVTVNES